MSELTKKDVGEAEKSLSFKELEEGFGNEELIKEGGGEILGGEDVWWGDSEQNEEKVEKEGYLDDEIARDEADENEVNIDDEFIWEDEILFIFGDEDERLLVWEELTIGDEDEGQRLLLYAEEFIKGDDKECKIGFGIGEIGGRVRENDAPFPGYESGDAEPEIEREEEWWRAWRGFG